MNINIRRAVQEFYGIASIDAIMKTEEFRHSHERWERDYRQYRTEYIRNLARLVYDYTVLAVAGEMRHGRYECTHYYPDFYGRETSRSNVYSGSVDYDPVCILKAGIQLFKCDWGSSFGGEAWETIAKAGLMYGKVPDMVFVDYCVDLSHNSSVYMDKEAGLFTMDDTYLYKKWLDYKRYASPVAILQGVLFSRRLAGLIRRGINLDILPDVTDIHVTPWTDRIYDDWNTTSCLFNRSDIQDSYDDTSDSILQYEPIDWGLDTINTYMAERNIDEDEDEETEEDFGMDEEDEQYEFEAERYRAGRQRREVA
jgi:hypothetical protein